MRAFKFILLAGIILLGNSVFAQDNNPKSDNVEFSKIGSNRDKSVIVIEFTGGNQQSDVEAIQKIILGIKGVESGNFSVHQDGYIIGKIVTDQTVIPQMVIDALKPEGYGVSEKSLVKK